MSVRLQETGYGDQEDRNGSPTAYSLFRPIGAFHGADSRVVSNVYASCGGPNHYRELPEEAAGGGPKGQEE